VPILAEVARAKATAAPGSWSTTWPPRCLAVLAASILGVAAAPLLVWLLASGLARDPRRSTWPLS